MAKKREKQSKIDLGERFIKIFKNHKSVISIIIDNISSKHIQNIRMQLRNDAIIVKGKNSFLKKLIKDNSNPKEAQNISSLINGNCALIFTNKDIKPLCKIVKESKILTSAKPGVLAPNEVIVPPGLTGFPPEMTNFFQTLNIPTKIVKGQIQIVNEINLIKKGQKVGNSEVELLSKLKIKPFLFGPQITSIYNDGIVFGPEILELDENKVASLVSEVAAIVSAIGVETELPNTASVPNSLRNVMNVLVSITMNSDYSFKEAEQMISLMGSDKLAKSEKVFEKNDKEEEDKKDDKEEEEEAEAEFGNLFGDDDDDD